MQGILWGSVSQPGFWWGRGLLPGSQGIILVFGVLDAGLASDRSFLPDFSARGVGQDKVTRRERALRVNLGGCSQGRGCWGWLTWFSGSFSGLW